MIVLKFGGTSVGSMEAFQQVGRIVAQRTAEQAHEQKQTDYPLPGVIVVTSAMGGVTNLLIDAAQQAVIGNEAPSHRAEQTLRAKHQTVVDQLVQDESERAALRHLYDGRLREFRRLCSSIAVLGELTARGLDVVSGLGERMSAPLLAAILRAQGVAAKFVDAGDLVITDDVNGGAEPLMEQTSEQCHACLLPMLEQGIVPVITGFVGTSSSGTPTTLGRGGSDYSAAIIAAALDAAEVQIWTDVNGVLTADPRVVPNARSLNQLSYEEVGEMAYYGAKVLHAKTVAPAIEKQIPIRVLNTFAPEHPGTLIMGRAEVSSKGTVKAVTSIRDLNMITVAGRGMLGVPGIAARTFGSVARVGASVLMITQSSSEQSICFVVPNGHAEEVVTALEVEFADELGRHYIDRIYSQPNIAIMAVVGSGMRGTPGIAANIFNAVGQHGVNVIAIAQGASETNINVVISEDDVAEAVHAVHDAFELHKPTPERQVGRVG